MNKRIAKSQAQRIPVEHIDTPEESLNSTKALQSIQKKLEASAALNGGFDKLLYKIDSIENNQVQIGNKVDKIHEAIYHPDDGIFARINSTKVDHLESVSKVENQVSQLVIWQQKQSKETEDVEKEASQFSLKLQQIETAIDRMHQSKAFFNSILKWSGAALGGATVSLLFRYFYEVVLKH
jgi:hypothetical protein